jgi:uncharacterized protein YggE
MGKQPFKRRKMKRTMIALALSAALSTAATAQQNVSIVENQNYIEVTGYNRAEVAPDEITVAFRIDESDSKGRTAIADQEKEMVKALQKIGIDTEKQLTVKDMSSNFRKYILRQTDVMNSRDYELKVSDAQTAAAVFAALESVKIANASVTKAEYSKIDDFTLENKVAAMKNAQEKAAKLAAAIGQGIGKAIYIQDFERTYRGGGYTNVMLTKVVSVDMAMEASQAMAPGIEFEKITVESNVSVRFLLE